MFQDSQAHNKEVQIINAAYGILHTIGCMYNLDLLMMGL